MKFRSLAAIITFCLFSTGASAQMLTAYTSPLDVPTNPRSVAMGESFVALPGDPTALMSNPAGLAGLHGMGISYSQRSMNWMSGLEDYRYHGANAYYAAPFGVFGIEYNRLSMGEFTYSIPSSPMGVGTLQVYEHSIVVGFGAELMEGFSAGIATKYLDIVYTVTGGKSQSSPAYAVTPAYLFDAGAQYSVPILPGDSSIQHLITTGISVQNIGTELKSSSSTETESSSETPRYLRLGFSYRLTMLPQGPEGLRPVAMVLTAEYRRVINGSTYQDSRRDYWGCGVEFTLFEVASVRMGGVVLPYTSIYGDKGCFKLRGGFGVHVPLARLGVSAPLVLSGNYALIPINRYPNSFMSGNTDNLSTFSVELEYVAP